MKALLNSINNVLQNPTEKSIFDLFERDGFLRFNMLYISPIAIKHFRDKLLQYDLIEWKFYENELVFVLKDMVVKFRGDVKLTLNKGIFCLELDFDPIVNDDEGMEFLKDIETFLKKCDSCFFMTYFISIDAEILKYPLTKSLEYLINRK